METQTGVEVDAEGNNVLTLERKSVQPFRTQDEYLYAMKEDLAEWFNTLYKRDVNVDDFFEQLETGILLCEHANNVNDFIMEHNKNQKNGQEPTRIQYKANVKAGSFQCRDNLCNFIGWCRWTLSIPDTLLFESDDLVMRKNERNVVLCLLEVARRGARYGMLAPILVQLEVEIDAEIAGEEPPPRPPQPPRPRRMNDMMSLDEMVREIAKLCTCPDEFPIIRISEGKYKVGESLTLIFVRILRNHVMVRIGGGWDTLENYLNRHDPCRCAAAKSHKPRKPVSRRASMPSASNLQGLEVTKSRQLPSTPSKSGEPTRRSDDYERVTRRPSSATPRSVERLRRSDETPCSLKSHSNRPSSPAQTNRTQSPAPGTTTRRPQSPANTPKRPSSPVVDRQNRGTNIAQPRKTTERRLSLTSGGLHKHFNSNTDLSSSQTLSVKKPEPVKPQPKRPQSAGPNAHSRILRSKDTNVCKTPDRGRSPSRPATSQSNHARSRSVGAAELRKHMIPTASSIDFDKSNEVLMISRDNSGHHIVSANEQNMNSSMPMTNGYKGYERALSSTRVPIAADKLLPSKPKNMMRSQSTESKTLSDRQDSDESSGSNSEKGERPGLRRQASVSSVGSFGSLIEEDAPAPEADHVLNEHMERLFEEYRRIEKGWFNGDDQEVNEIASLNQPNRKLPASPAVKKTRPGSAGPRKTSTHSQPGASASSRQAGRQTPTTPRRSSLSASSSSSSISSTNYKVRPTTPTTSRRTLAPANARASPQNTPSTQRRTVTPIRPVPIRPTPNNPHNNSSTMTPVARSASMQRDRSTSQYRSRTPNPESGSREVCTTPLRSKTPVVKMKTDEVKSRIDTGLKNRPTTPVSRSGSQRRSSSLSRVAVNKQLGGDSLTLSKTTPRPRSRSREDLLDSDSSERRSRSDIVRKRDERGGRRSGPREINQEQYDTYNGHPGQTQGTQAEMFTNFVREPRRTLPPTPGMLSTDPPPEPVTVEIPDDHTRLQQGHLEYSANPRKDDRVGVKTRIPRPSSALGSRVADLEMNTLKRFDSGVDINISPTENSSIQGEGECYIPWQQNEAVSLSPRALAFEASRYTEPPDEYY